MAESLALTQNASKKDRYQEILPQIESIITGEKNLIANLANITAILNEAFNHLWTGFYIREKNELVLGPFQGPLACTRISLTPPKGVCGAAADQGKTLVVPDVEAFPGHIACSSLSKSEIVLPLIANGQTQLVLDIDSAELNTFDGIDAQYLEKIVALLGKQHF